LIRGLPGPGLEKALPTISIRESALFHAVECRVLKNGDCPEQGGKACGNKKTESSTANPRKEAEGIPEQEQEKMVTQREQLDRVNGIDLGVLNETVAAVRKDPALGKCKFRARNKWIGGDLNCSTIADFHAAKQEFSHKEKIEMRADEPPMLAGEDRAANPVEYLLHALASCITTSMVAHAAVKGIDIEEMESELEGDIDLNGFFGLNPDAPKGYTDIRVKFKIKTDPKNLDILKSFSEFSPVYNTISRGAKVHVDLNLK
jgi:uncharacterized OsmC-like protein